MAWQRYKFNESLTGLEDMYLAKEMTGNGKTIGYVATSVVHHVHNETWDQVKNRYEREAIALQEIMPEVHISFINMINFIIAGILIDLRRALNSRVFFKEFIGVFKFRTLQFYGSYRGNHKTKKISHDAKIKYYYPEIK